MHTQSNTDARWRQKCLGYSERHGVTKASIQYHVSRKTIYKWRKRYDGTLESLKDRSRAPKNHPGKTTEEEAAMVRKRIRQCRWTDVILAYQICCERDGYSKSYSSFCNTVMKLRGNKGKKKQTRKKLKPYERAEYPGQKVQLDVKYVPRECAVNGVRYYQYTAVDECTRWTYRQMYEEHSTHSSVLFLSELVQAAPFPIRVIQTDNGTEFTKELLSPNPAKTSFELLLQEMGIEYKRIRPATPRHNGKVERQHRIDTERFYSRLRMFSLADGRKQLAVYQKKSNGIIKMCLGMRSPDQVLEGYLGVI